jgi:YD repeat-containing protein
MGSTVPVPTTQTEYDLDKQGNWNQKVKDWVTETRQHNKVNEITQINVVPILSDDNGNFSEDERYTYAYDEENRLIGVTLKSDGKEVGQYHYDALSRRIAKIADPTQGPAAPAELQYYYDNARIVEEEDTSGASLTTYIDGNYVDEASHFSSILPASRKEFPGKTTDFCIKAPLTALYVL